MKIIWRKQAEIDLDEVFDYLAQRSLKRALHIYETIRQKVEQLATQPELGRPGRVAGTRELVITRTPYLVAYKIDPHQHSVIVLRVLHGARLWPDSFDEDDGLSSP